LASSILPRYTHIVNSKLKHIYLVFDEYGELVIKSPKISQQAIERLLLKKASWINNSRKKLEDKKGKTIDFSKELELYFLGKSHILKLIPDEKKGTKLLFDGSIFTIYYDVYDEIIFCKHIDKFYKEEVRKYVPELVEEWEKIMKVKGNKITFRKVKRQWGSCSAENNLSFNTMIMKLPPKVIQYIVVHELAHIKHKHHQKSFWEFVAQYLPEYKIQINELKKFTT